MSSPPFLGIDFGTCNSSMAWFNPRTGQAAPLRNAEGEDKTPSVVYLGPKEILVGRYAEDKLESPEDRKRVLPPVKRELAKPRVWMAGARLIAPVEAAAEILKKLKRDAEEGHFHEPVSRAVITCPAIFDELEKDKLREAARRAGFQEVELLPEPVAAALAYAQAGVKVGRHILVYDLGGGTFDLALLVRDDGDDGFRLAMEPRGDRIGGEDFDRALYDHFDELFQKQARRPLCIDGVDLHLLKQCRKWKENLSVTERSGPFSWWVPDLRKAIKVEVKRARFEELIREKVERTIRLARSIRDEALATGCDVSSVILIGGSSRIPLVTRRLQETLQVEPRKWEMQYVAVALGAAYHANHKWGEKRSGGQETPQIQVTKSPTADERRAVQPSAEAEAFLAQSCELLLQSQNLSNSDTGEAQAMRLKHLTTALQHVQAACDLEPNWGFAFFYKGIILAQLGEWLLATAAFTVYLRLVPSGDLDALGWRGFCKLMMGDYRGARQDLTEAIRFQQSEMNFRRRAAACLHLPDVDRASILSDIQAALARANQYSPIAASVWWSLPVAAIAALTRTDQDTPVAALHATAGFLWWEELHHPEKAIDSFSEALKALPRDIGPVAKRQFSSDCHFLGIADRLVRGLLPAESKMDIDNPVAAIQHALWSVCKVVHGGCTLAAVSAFQDDNHPLEDIVLRTDPLFALHAASLTAQRGNSYAVLHWLGELLRIQPNFDIRAALRDPAIARLRDRSLKEFLTPKWSVEEEHGLLFNCLTATNHSVFRLTSVVVTAHLERTDDTFVPPIKLRVPWMDAGKSQRWEKVFPDPGLFGSKIRKVQFTLECSESNHPLPPSPPPGSG